MKLKLFVTVSILLAGLLITGSLLSQAETKNSEEVKNAIFNKNESLKQFPYYKRVQKLIEAEHFSGEEEQLNEWIKKEKNSRKPNTLAYLYFTRGVIYQVNLDYEKALIDFQLVEKHTDEPQLIVNSLIGQILIYKEKYDDNEKALELIEKASKLNTLDNKVKYQLTLLKGLSLFNIGHYSAADSLYNGLLSQKSKVLLANEYLLAELYAAKGLLLHTISNYPEAESFFEKALKHNYDSSLNRAKILSWKGLNDLQLKKYDSAYEAFYEAEKLYRPLGDSHWKYALMLHNLGLYHKHTGELEKALDYYKKAEKGYMSLGIDSYPYARLKLSIGNVFSELGNKEKALFYYEQALPGFLKLGKDNVNYARLMYGTGFLHLKTKQYELATDYFKKAQPILQKVKPNSKSYGEFLRHYSLSYIGLKQYDEAALYYRESLIILKHHMTEKEIKESKHYLLNICISAESKKEDRYNLERLKTCESI